MEIKVQLDKDYESLPILFSKIDEHGNLVIVIDSTTYEEKKNDR